MINIRLGDCMKYMKEYDNNHFDLAIVDPPYGMDKKATIGGGIMVTGDRKLVQDTKIQEWDIAPNKEYFTELMRISKNQIIWGGNYFIDHLYSSRGIICWDKVQPFETFSRWEMAWTSYQKGIKSVAKYFKYDNRTGGKIHPTQKPIELYKWLLSKYADEGDLILDTHLGSGSIAVACYDMGYDLEAYEIDREYYETAKKRIDELTKQEKLF